MATTSTGSGPAGLELNQDLPHSARIYDYYLGGKSHYSADRKAASEVIQAFPDVMVCAREIRSFMHRATRVLARDHGFRQWLDIGTGVPTSPNLHEVAQTYAPGARVVYADNDPIVLAHARALLAGKESTTSYVHARFQEPEVLLKAPELTGTIDLSEPVVLSLNALLHFVPDDQDPYGLVARYLEALPSGSALALSHCTPDFAPEVWENVVGIYERSGTPAQVRSREEVARFFEGLDLIDPGLAVAHEWRPEEFTEGVPLLPGMLSRQEVSSWTAIGIKP